jgi:hypothetical protein
MITRPEITGRRTPGSRTIPNTDSDLDAFSLAEFCRRNSISISTFYQMKK